MRPRDIIRFVRKAIEVGINRNHDKVLEEDILQAEISYSEDALQDLVFELKDINPKYSEIPFEFLNSKSRLNYQEIANLITPHLDSSEDVDEAINLLVWFGFLGVALASDKTRYSYEIQYNIRKLNISSNTVFIIHPCFRAALECN